MIDYEDIQDRACVMYDILSEYIDRGHEEVPSHFISTFKCSLALKSKSVGLFIRSFREQGYNLDIFDIENTYDYFKDELPGGVG